MVEDIENNVKQARDLQSLGLVSVVVPAYNEEDNLNVLYERIRAVLEKEGKDFELIVIENGSTDGSLGLLKMLRKKDARVNYLSLTRNFGHQGALIAGLEYSSGDIVITMDADLQHPPELISKLLKLWQDGYDVVYTIKHQNKDNSALRNVFNRLFYGLMNRLSGIELRGQSDFRLMDRKVVDILSNLPERNKFLRGLISWIGLRQVGIEYNVPSRFAGISKFRFIHLIELAIDGILSFSIIPLRVFTLFGLLVSTGSFIYGVYLLVLKINATIQGNHAWGPAGWVTLTCVMLFLGGIQLIGIGLLGEYLGRVYDETKGRPIYIVREGTINLRNSLHIKKS